MTVAEYRNELVGMLIDGGVNPAANAAGAPVPEDDGVPAAAGEDILTAAEPEDPAPVSMQFQPLWAAAPPDTSSSGGGNQADTEPEEATDAPPTITPFYEGGAPISPLADQARDPESPYVKQVIQDSRGSGAWDPDAPVDYMEQIGVGTGTEHGARYIANQRLMTYARKYGLDTASNMSRVAPTALIRTILSAATISDEVDNSPYARLDYLTSTLEAAGLVPKTREEILGGMLLIEALVKAEDAAAAAAKSSASAAVKEKAEEKAELKRLEVKGVIDGFAKKISDINQIVIANHEDLDVAVGGREGFWDKLQPDAIDGYWPFSSGALSDNDEHPGVSEIFKLVYQQAANVIALDTYIQTLPPHQRWEHNNALLEAKSTMLRMSMTEMSGKVRYMTMFDDPDKYLRYNPETQEFTAAVGPGTNPTIQKGWMHPDKFTWEQMVERMGLAETKRLRIWLTDTGRTN